MKRCLVILVSLALLLSFMKASADTQVWLTTEGAGIVYTSDGPTVMPPPPPGYSAKEWQKMQKRHNKEMLKMEKKHRKEMKKAAKRHDKEMRKARKRHDKDMRKARKHHRNDCRHGRHHR